MHWQYLPLMPVWLGRPFRNDVAGRFSIVNTVKTWGKMRMKTYRNLLFLNSLFGIMSVAKPLSLETINFSSPSSWLLCSCPLQPAILLWSLSHTLWWSQNTWKVPGISEHTAISHPQLLFLLGPLPLWKLPFQSSSSFSLIRFPTMTLLCHYWDFHIHIY